MTSIEVEDLKRKNEFGYNHIWDFPEVEENWTYWSINKKKNRGNKCGFFLILSLQQLKFILRQRYQQKTITTEISYEGMYLKEKKNADIGRQKKNRRENKRRKWTVLGRFLWRWRRMAG
ncbi:hypothetical protein SAY86_001792 [Trapa natans]|uniref:Uncharacterized protein n=1 Tax=Trapa natans TaxID=22666 RepID=A0AAN7R448_TRANT|nr:hypothetical protein SAY86_001792 [Trapa natans]